MTGHATTVRLWLGQKEKLKKGGLDDAWSFDPLTARWRLEGGRAEVFSAGEAGFTGVASGVWGTGRGSLPAFSPWRGVQAGPCTFAPT